VLGAPPIRIRRRVDPSVRPAKTKQKKKASRSIHLQGRNVP
jgi:hypothetical protein